MTVSTTATLAGPFTGNGATTSFAFTFKAVAGADVKVAIWDSTDLVAAEQVYDTDYSVTLNADQEASPGGSVTYPLAGAALSATERLLIYRGTPLSQGLDLVNGGSFSATNIESALDRALLLLQELTEVQARTLKYPRPITTGGKDVPAPVVGEVLGWGAGGVLQNYAREFTATYTPSTGETVMATYTSAVLAAGATEFIEVVAGFGAVDLDFGGTIIGSDGVAAGGEAVSGIIMGSDGRMVALRTYDATAFAVAAVNIPAAGSITIAVRNNDADAQAVSVNYWVRAVGSTPSVAAEVSAAAAAASALAASGSATAASGSATTANGSAVAAAASELAADGSAVAAAASELAADGSAVAAAASALAASDSATAASGSATAASGSATAASGSATTASGYATAASGSATAADASAIAAAASAASIPNIASGTVSYAAADTTEDYTIDTGLGTDDFDFEIMGTDSGNLITAGAISYCTWTHNGGSRKNSRQGAFMGLGWPADPAAVGRVTLRVVSDGSQAISVVRWRAITR